MGKNWAIIIGINQYDNLQPLQYAKRDAEAVRDYFLNEASFEKVYFFSEDAPDIEQDHGPPFNPLPTFTKLDRFLDVRFDQPFLGPGDNFWFFFAGHGKRHHDRDYLLPSDVNPRKIEGTAIPINYIAERLRRCGADNTILILDACRDRSDRSRGEEGIGTEVQKGVITLFSCSPNELSYEIDELQQGAFTHTLLCGLRDQGEGSCATVERLYRYLHDNLPSLNCRYNKPKQTPYGVVEPPTKYHLILFPQKAISTDVDNLRDDAQKAEVAREYSIARQLWIRVLAVSLADPEAVEGIQRLARLSNPSVSTPSFSNQDGIKVQNHEATTDLKAGARRAELRQDYPLARKLWIQVLAISLDLEAVEGIERVAVYSCSLPPPPPPISISSIYRNLQEALEASNWKQADYETYLVMLKAVGRKKIGWLRREEIERITCDVIITIDQLWTQCSNNKFGLSVQQNLWLSVGGQAGRFDYTVFCEFSDLIGWREDDDWWIKKYNDFTFSLEAKEGHLPSLGCGARGDETNWWNYWKDGLRSLLPLISTCLLDKNS